MRRVPAFVTVAALAALVTTAVPWTESEAPRPARRRVWTGPVPTYARDIAPILRANCEECHRLEGMAHFSLETYQAVKSYADQIRFMTSTRRMPPWKPVRGCGEFAGVRGLSQDQIDRIAAWADGGAPEGDPADLPPPRLDASSWKLGPPDRVLKVPVPYAPPAGRESWRTFVIPLEQAGCRYLAAIDVRPSAAEVVHHISAMLDTSGKTRAMDAADPGPGYDSGMDPQFMPAAYFGNWFSHAEPVLVPEGVAQLMPKGSDLVLFVHYAPRQSEPRADQTEVALYYAKKPPRRLLEYRTIAFDELDIPAGDADVRVQKSYEVPADIHLYSIGGHMHYLGRTMSVMVRRSDGSRSCLLRIDDWDPAWGGVYQFARPVPVPAGSVIELRASFDNSAGNLRNPSSPPVDVHFGQTTKDEMCYTEFTYTADLQPAPPACPGS